VAKQRETRRAGASDDDLACDSVCFLVKFTRLHHAGDDLDIASVRSLIRPARLHHAGGDLATILAFFVAEPESRR
jgi:hypothetical protein